MSQLNWVCNNCGRTFSRNDTARRHIERLHNGNGGVVRFSDYIVSKKTGTYKPNLLEPMNRTSEDRIKRTFTNAFYDEIGRLTAQSFYKKHLNSQRYFVIPELLLDIQEMLFENELTPRVKLMLKSSFDREYNAALESEIKQLKQETRHLSQTDYVSTNV